MMLGVFRRMLDRAAVRLVSRVLSSPEVQKQLWEIHSGFVHGMPAGEALPRNTWAALWDRASRSTAEYIETHMVSCRQFPSRWALFDHCLQNVEVDGLYLEFGCGWKAETIRYLASRLPPETVIHGFDSFEGIPDDWFGGRPKGAFRSGNLPDLPDNVRLHKGWFSEVLPEFLKTESGAVSFMHVDCDVYSSTKDIFDHLGERIVPGTVIQFDEYFNYPGWKEHEYKAFQEFVARRGFKYQYLGYTPRFPVAVKIIG